jgi:hypothetical protein
MALTRARVEAELTRMAREAEGRGIAAADRDGQALSPRAIGDVYRDVKRCLFCGQRLSTMAADAVSLAPPTTRFFPGPNEHQVRLLFYGMCRGHETQVARDPQPWAERVRKVFERRLAERVKTAARTN